MPPLRVGVLGSTRGTDLQAIIEAIEQGLLPNVLVSIVISNRSKAGILDKASKHGIEGRFVSAMKEEQQQGGDDAPLPPRVRNVGL